MRNIVKYLSARSSGERMKLLFFQWNAFMQRGIENAFKCLGIAYDTYYYIFQDWDYDDVFVENFTKKLKSGGYDTVFSVNFSPLIALACADCQVHYIAWVYDCPLHIRRTDTLKLSCCDVYFFDRVQAQQYQAQGAAHAHHLPLAADPAIFQAEVGRCLGGYDCDVSLVGQLYQSDFGYLCGPLDAYSRGYLEGCVRAQIQLSGGYLLHEMVTEELMEQLNVQYAKASKGKVQVLPAQLEYTLACEATGRERVMALALLQKRCSVRLYSQDKNETLSALAQMGYVDYYTRMPQVFAKSRINLNISLAAICSGIPLRILDILSSGGFVLTNLQPELLEYFEPERDIVIYQDMKELVDKVQYYLAHEKAREEIAQRGQKIVREAFSFEDRIRKMFLK